jgi:hypothetical protein
MMRRLLVIVAAVLAPAIAAADITFEPETPAPPTATQSPTPLTPPPVIPPPVHRDDDWKLPILDFRLVTRASVDTAFDYKGENVAEWYNFLTASIRTQKGNLRILFTARLRWAAYEEAPTTGTFNFFNGAQPHADFNPWLGESYVSYSRWGIDFIAGMLDVAWGQNVAFSPADVLTPLDLRDGPFLSADERLPVPAVRIRGAAGPIRFDAVWLPFFIPSQQPLLGNDWSPYAVATQPVIPNLQSYLDPSTWTNISTNLLATKLPPMNLTAPQGGIRLSAHPGPVSVAVTWADFFDRNPAVAVTPAFRSLVNSAVAGNSGAAELAALAVQTDLQNGKAPLSATYYRTMVFAGDAAVQTGPVRWTLDAGYSPERVFPLVDLTTTVAPMLSGVAGLEWEGPPILAAGVYSLLAFHVPAGERLLFLETSHASIDRDRNVALALAYLALQERLFEDRLELGLTSMVSFRGDFFATPSAHWHFGDPHSLGIGANIVAGPSGSFGAEYAHNDEVFVEYILRL